MSNCIRLEYAFAFWCDLALVDDSGLLDSEVSVKLVAIQSERIDHGVRSIDDPA